MFQIDTGNGTAPPVQHAKPTGAGFARHGITHLSASSLNLWTSAPDLWVAKYLHGHKQPFGPAPRRGQCVEQAVFDALHGKPEDEAIARAVSRFDATFKNTTDATEKERALIEPMAQLAIAELRSYGPPEQPHGDEQQRIQIRADFGDWSIPVIGFLDFQFPTHGLVVDLKTTTRIPSEMSAEHKLQRAIYDAATGNAAVKFLYVSAKKTALLEDGDTAETLAKAKAQIARLDRFLAAVDADTALAIVPHNPSSFFWRDDAEGRTRLFG